MDNETQKQQEGSVEGAPERVWLDYLDEYTDDWQAWRRPDFANAAVPVEYVRTDLGGLKAERDLLAEAIANAAQKAGIYNGEVPLTGPDLLLLCENLVTVAARNLPPQEKQLRQEPKDATK